MLDVGRQCWLNVSTTSTRARFDKETKMPSRVTDDTHTYVTNFPLLPYRLLVMLANRFELKNTTCLNLLTA